MEEDDDIKIMPEDENKDLDDDGEDLETYDEDD